MRAVAIGRIARILAAAEQRKLAPLRREHQRLDPGAGMRAVAKRLLLAPAAAAPSIAFAGLELDLIRVELRSFWLSHNSYPLPSRPLMARSCALLSQFAQA